MSAVRRSTRVAAGTSAEDDYDEKVEEVQQEEKQRDASDDGSAQNLGNSGLAPDSPIYSPTGRGRGRGAARGRGAPSPGQGGRGRGSGGRHNVSFNVGSSSSSGLGSQGSSSSSGSGSRPPTGLTRDELTQILQTVMGAVTMQQSQPRHSAAPRGPAQPPVAPLSVRAEVSTYEDVTKSGDPMLHIDQLELLATASNWPEDRLITQFRLSLRGHALVWSREAAYLFGSPPAPWRAVKDAFIQDMRGTTWTRDVRRQFDDLKMRANETVEEYTYRFREQFALVRQTSDAFQRLSLNDEVDRYTAGLRADISATVRSSLVRSFDEAHELARNVESVRTTAPPAFTPAATPSVPLAPQQSSSLPTVAVNALQSTDEPDYVQRLESAITRLTNSCGYCGREGHYITACRTRRREREQYRGESGGERQRSSSRDRGRGRDDWRRDRSNSRERSNSRGRDRSGGRDDYRRRATDRSLSLGRRDDDGGRRVTFVDGDDYEDDGYSSDRFRYSRDGRERSPGRGRRQFRSQRD